MSSEEPSPGNDDFPRPIWKYSHLIAFAILHSPNETANFEEIFDFIIENFPFFKSMDKQTLRSSLKKTLRFQFEWFKKAETSVGRLANLSLNDREFAIRAFKNLTMKRRSVSHPMDAVKIGMKYPEKFDLFLSKNANVFEATPKSPAKTGVPGSEASTSYATATANVFEGAPINVFAMEETEINSPDTGNQ